VVEMGAPFLPGVGPVVAAGASAALQSGKTNRPQAPGKRGGFLSAFLGGAAGKAGGAPGAPGGGMLGMLTGVFSRFGKKSPKTGQENVGTAA